MMQALQRIIDVLLGDFQQVGFLGKLLAQQAIVALV